MKLVPGTPAPEFRSSIALTYDNVAADRDEAGEADWRWPIAERFLQRMKDAGKTTLLEIGAGVGYTSRWFADKGVSVMATDLAPQQVELCRPRGLEAHVRDMYELGFDRQSFGALWAMNCIHHVPNRDLPRILAGFARVLEPGGLAYIGVWGGRDDEGIPEDDFYLPPRFFSFRSDQALTQMIEGAFDIASFETFEPGEGGDDGLHMQSYFLRKGKSHGIPPESPAIGRPSKSDPRASAAAVRQIPSG